MTKEDFLARLNTLLNVLSTVFRTALEKTGEGLVHLGNWLKRLNYRFLFWSFWVKRILFSRVLPITLLVFVTYNPWDMSYFSWSKTQFQNLWSAGSSWDDVFLTVFLPWLLVTLILLGAWVYIANRAWHGIGAKWYKAAIPIAIVLVFFALLWERELLPSGNWLIVLVEGAIGLLLGLGFSATIIDRYLSGMYTVITPHGDPADYHDQPLEEHPGQPAH